MPDEEGEHSSIPKDDKKEELEMWEEELATWTESAAKEIDNIIEDTTEAQRKFEEAHDYYEIFSERVTRLEMLRNKLRDIMQTYEENVRIVSDPTDIDYEELDEEELAEELFDKLATEVDSSELEGKDK